MLYLPQSLLEDQMDSFDAVCVSFSDPVKSWPMYSNSMLEWPIKEIKVGLPPARPVSVQGMLYTGVCLSTHQSNWQQVIAPPLQSSTHSSCAIARVPSWL